MVRASLVLLVCSVLGCSNNPPSGSPDMAMMGGGMTLTSSAFTAGGTIPDKYAEDPICARAGAMNISPPLAWSGAPVGTMSFALSMDDVTLSPPLNHWMLWGMPSTQMQILERYTEALLIQGSVYGNGTYAGPCPGNEVHQYRFTLYAVSDQIDLPFNLTDQTQFQNALAGKVLAEATLTASYQGQ